MVFPRGGLQVEMPGCVCLESENGLILGRPQNERHHVGRGGALHDKQY